MPEHRGRGRRPRPHAAPVHGPLRTQHIVNVFNAAPSHRPNLGPCTRDCQHFPIWPEAYLAQLDERDLVETE